MTVGYRSLLHFDVNEHDLFRYVDEQLRCWLEGKRYDADRIVEGRFELAGDATGDWLDRTEQNGTRTKRFRLIEHKREGPWSVTVVAHAGARQRPWVLTEVDGPVAAAQESAGLPPWTGTPKFIRLLLAVTEGRDGEAAVTSRPRIVRSDDVDHVIDVICDVDRRGLAFVAGTPDGFALDRWQDFIDERVRETVGVASTYLLDEPATRRLNAALGEHGLLPGALMRSYVPGADPASERDRRRHRMLSTETLLRRSPRYIQKTLGAAARARVSELPLPRDVTRIVRLVERWGTARLLTPLPDQRPDEHPGTGPVPADASSGSIALAPSGAAPDVVAHAAVIVALASAVQEILGDVSLDADAVLVLADRARGASAVAVRDDLSIRLESMQDQLDLAELAEQELRQELDDVQLDAAEDLDQLVVALDHVRHLQKVLSQAGKSDVAYAPVPDEEETQLPESMSDLVTWLPRLRNVEFTGDTDTALDLDQFDPLGGFAKQAWRGLLALDDYARLRSTGGFAGSFHDYCRQPPPGVHVWPANRVTLTESELTRNNPKFAKPRRFPVPTLVERSGQVAMWAHLKIANFATISPRLHFHDDSAQTGKVYVGYVGRHLPNTQTN